MDRAKGVWVKREKEEQRVNEILQSTGKGYTLILADSGSVSASHLA